MIIFSPQKKKNSNLIVCSTLYARLELVIVEKKTIEAICFLTFSRFKFAVLS